MAFQYERDRDLYCSTPQVKNGICEWRVPDEFVENDALFHLGLLQNSLQKTSIKECRIDCSMVQWADPLAVLYLGLVLAESHFTKSSITIDFGSCQAPDNGHGVLLKFLAQQGFIKTLATHADLFFDNRHQPDVDELHFRLATLPQATHFQNADCILARIIPNSKLGDQELQKQVEELLCEARTRLFTFGLSSDRLARDILFQKLRKLIYELLLNVSEHSHPEKEHFYAGVYARVRGAKPTKSDDALRWTELFNKCNRINGQSQFRPNPYAEWVELYVCDGGIGLTSQIKDWKAPEGDRELARILDAAKQSGNPLFSIAPQLFKSPLSRFPRHDSERTAVTGLQHLGNILSHGGDYCRIYSQNGTWLGGQHPWPKDVSGSRNTLLNQSRKSSSEGVSGTAYVFSIQPNHRMIEKDEGFWHIPDAASRLAIIDTLRHNDHLPSSFNIDYQEFCDSQVCWPPHSMFSNAPDPKVIILRPPKLLSKQDLGRWLMLVAGARGAPAKRVVNRFIVAELTPFQMLMFGELLLHVYVHETSKVEIFLVARNWAVTCLSTSPGQHRFYSNDDKAALFFSPITNSTDFNASALAILLRKSDSEIFWYPQDYPSRISDKPFDKQTGRKSFSVPRAKDGLPTAITSQPFFLDAPVEWLNARGDVECVLGRYLDLPHALTDPRRYAACLRALRRMIELFPDNDIVAGDDLMTSLVKEAQMDTYIAHHAAQESRSKVIVGSVGVTLATANENALSPDEQTMHLMIHRDANPTNFPEELVALLWISQVSKSADRGFRLSEVPSQSPWRRIPHTPFIAPDGEKSVSILRYKRTDAGTLDFSKPWYGRTPEETYKDFDRLRILKTGHWKYGSHHDLLTVNLWLAFQFSHLEQGPLYTWLNRQFHDFFAPASKRETARCQVLIYPSHRVTDTIIDRIRRDPSFDGVRPQGGMIPVKFLGTHTVSPLLASYMVKHHIEALKAKFEWQSWSGVVLDDGAVTGKHLRELTQFLQSWGAREVCTLALIDRTGLPAQDAVMQRFLERHRRFWRWDVPTLGHGRDCPLCQALNIAQTSASKLESQRQKERLKEWERIWRAREVDSEWHQTGLPAVPFASGLRITFGIDIDESGAYRKKKIVINDSSAAASLLVELTRLTTRADVAFAKAQQIKSDYPAASLEILIIQTLLFFDELRCEEKRERLEKIVDLLWVIPITSNVTALGGLLFALVDHTLLRGMWSYCKAKHLCSRLLANLDAIIAVNLVRNRFRFVFGEDYKPGSDANGVERANYVLLGGGGLRHLIREFLNIYRNPDIPGRISDHTTPLRQRLIHVVDNRSPTPAGVSVDLQVIWAQATLVQEIIERLIAEGSIRAVIDFDPLNEALDVFSALLSDECKLKKQLDWGQPAINAARRLLDILYGVSGQQGILRCAANEFLKRLESPTGIESFIGDLSMDVRSQWPEVLEHRKADERARRWLSDVESRPIFCCGDLPPSEELWLYCDSFIEALIKDLMLNVFHSSGPMPNVWEINDSDMADLWWRVVKEGNYLMLETMNATEDRMISLKQSVNIAGLERAGGTIEAMICVRAGRSIVESFPSRPLLEGESQFYNKDAKRAEHAPVSEGSEALVAHIKVRIPLHSSFLSVH